MIKYFKPLAILLSSTPFLLLILNSIKLEKNYRFAEVIFFSKKSQKRKKRNSDSDCTEEALRVPIDNLDSFSRYEYCEGGSVHQLASSSNGNSKKWIPLQTSNQKKLFLAKLARYFLYIQHNLNLLKSAEIEEKNWDLEKLECCKEECEGKKCCLEKSCPNFCLSCCYLSAKDSCLQKCKCLKECCKEKSNCSKDFTSTQKKFFFSLKNTSGISYNSYYLSPIRAYLWLGDLEFSQLDSSQLVENGESSYQNGQTKTLTGSMTYGFIDYYYKPLKESPKKLKEDYQAFTKKSLEETASSNNSPFFFSTFPLSLSYTVSGVENGQETESESTQSNDCPKLIDLYKKFSDKKKLGNEELAKDESICCLLSRNYVFESSKESLEKCDKECLEKCRKECLEKCKLENCFFCCACKNERRRRR